jgi:CRP-like cAMP-binding protein
VSIIGSDETGREILLRTVATGDWFGDYCLCPGQQKLHPALEARADEDCQLVEVRHEDWWRELAANVAAVREFVTRTCLQLAQADRRLVMMARRRPTNASGCCCSSTPTRIHSTRRAGSVPSPGHTPRSRKPRP